MKTFLKIVGGLIGVIILLIGGGLFYLTQMLPNVGDAPDLTVELTEERIEHGKFLANHVFVCMDCHSGKNFSRFGVSTDTTTLGRGGNLYGMEHGFPGDYYAKNLTPYHLGDWTDGEIFRAITTGVSKDGHALFPIMPYTNYRRVDKEDIYDVIAYLRTLESIENDVPASYSPPPMNIIINTMPQEAAFVTKPDISDRVAYGEYLVISASCADCHTPRDDKGVPLPGMDFAGGDSFEMAGGTVYSANITPHEATGIGAWTEEMFIARFKRFQDPNDPINTYTVSPGEFNTEMPWRFYSGMSEEQLSAIFAYLSTLTPVENTMTRFVPHSD